MYRALSKTKDIPVGALRLTLFKDKGHSCWRETYAMTDLKEWFLRFRVSKQVKRGKKKTKACATKK